MADTASEATKLEKWRDQRDQMVPEEERTVLAPWQIHGIIMHVLNGYTWKEVAQKLRGGKGVDTLRKVFRSPAGLALRERLTELTDNPAELAKLVIAASSLDVTADLLVALEWAKEARDHRSVHSMTKDLLQIAGVSSEQKKREQPQTVHIHIEGGSLDLPIPLTSYEIVDEETD